MEVCVIKKNQDRVPFDVKKIENAITQAWIQCEYPNFAEIESIAKQIESELSDVVTVDDISNLVMSKLYLTHPDVARVYSSYKIHREQAKTNPSEIEKVLLNSDEVRLENANKNTHLTHIKNSYLAEIPSREEMRRSLPDDCLKAHDDGVVYFHDLSFSARPMTNCCLFNLEELFKGCEINSTWIDTPKSFRTACTVATQMLNQATSLQYGGITINLLHLVKFVDVSRKKLKNRIWKYDIPESEKEKILNDELQQEIRDGLQTFAYQNNTLCSGTGQAVFLSVSIWLSEDESYIDDYILVVKEFLRQRIQGMKDKDNVYVNPNFPKILYFLDENTMRGGKYYDITKLCAECSAKRLTPDYLSVKKHMELKGCVTPSINKACA